MVRGNMLRLMVALSAVAMIVNGCKCDGDQPPVTCADAVLTFEQPLADAMVDSPFDVSIVARTEDGTAFPFDSASLKVGTGTFTGEVSGNRATFTGVTAAMGVQELSAAIAAGSCSQTGKQNVTVRGTSCTTPRDVAVSFPQDRDGNGVLNGVELPTGEAITVKVVAGCTSGIQVRILQGNAALSAPTSFTNGEALVSLTDTNPANGRYDLRAEFLRDGQPVSPNGPASGVIEVTRSTPEISVTTNGVFGPKDDASMMAGFQLNVTGTAAEDLTCEFKLDGQTRGELQPVEGQVSAQFTLTAVSGMHTVTLTCTDVAGNTAIATGAIVLDFKAPDVRVTSPASTDGGANMVVTASSLAIGISADAEDDSVVVASIAGTSIATARIAGTAAIVTIPFGADGTYVIEIKVTDRAGNVGTTTLTVTVALDGCGLAFTHPLGSPVFFTPTELVNGSYSFRTKSRSVCAGTSATLFRRSTLADGGVGTQQVATATLSSTGTADFAPLMMTNGDFLFTAQIADVDGGLLSADVEVMVDLDGPSITNPIVPTGEMAAVLTAAQDTSASTAGVQRTLAYSARVPATARVDVCITQDTNGSVMLPTSPECGVGFFVLHQGALPLMNSFTFPDGTYDLKIVIVNTGVTPAPASAPIRLIVDGARPCLQGITRSLPQDTNGDGRLNIAELAGAQPRLQFTLGCGDVSPATLAAMNPVVIRDISNGVLGAVRASTTTFAGAVATVTLTDTYATEQNLNLFAEVTDIVGNKNLLVAMNDPSTFAFRVDPVAPQCSITSPTQSVLNIAQVPGGNLAVDVGTSSDVTATPVSVTFTGEMPRPVPAMLNTASTTYALTGDAVYSIGATCTDDSGNVTTAQGRTTRVDLIAPTCSISAPTAGASFSDNDVATTVLVGGVDGGTSVTVNSTVAGITNNLLQANAAGSQAQGTVRFPNGSQNVTASLADDTGNPCTTAPVSIVVNSTACSLDFVSPGAITTNARGSWLNRVGAGLAAEPAEGTPTPTTGTAVVGVVTADCGAGKNVYLYAGPSSTTPGGTPIATNSSGVATFPSQAFQEEGMYTVTIDNGAGRLSHRTFTVSLKAPSIGSIGLQRSATVSATVPVARNAALVFGAAEGNQRVDTATVNDLVFGDLSAANTNAQIALTLANIDGAAVGTFQGSLDVLEETTPLLPTVTVGGAPFTPSLPQLTLGHRIDDSATSLVIRVTSPAGNTYTSTHSAQVDVIAPAAPTVTRNVTSVRGATVELTWAAVYDDGTDVASGGLSGGTPAAGYNVRWTTELMSPGGIPTSTVFFNSSQVKDEGVTAWTAGSTTKSLSVPPVNSYFIAVRARDEVGNYSTFAVPPTLANRGREDLLLNPTSVASQRYGGVMTGPHLRTGPDAGVNGIGYGFGPGIGSLNADFVDDLIVASPNRAVTSDGGVLMPDGGVVAPGSSQTLAGAVYVYFGRSGFGPTSTCTLPDCQTIVPYQSQASALFGGEVSMGNVHVANSTPSARLDLLVSSVGYDANRGRVFLYFGNTASNALDTSDFIEFRGQEYGSRLGSVAKVIPDMNNDGINEIIVSARGEPVSGGNTGQGSLYLFFGRSRGAWTTLASSTDAVTGRAFVSVGAGTADRVLVGPTPVDNNFTATNLFAATRGSFSTLGDLTGDGVPDFVIAANKNNLNVAYLYSGADVVAATAAIPVPALRIDETDKGNTGVTNGFGTRVIGGQSILSSGSPDLIATQARPAGGTPSIVAACYVKVFSNGSSAGYGSAMSTISGSPTRLFGGWAETLDLNGDGLRDIMVGESSTASTTAWVFFQRNDRSFDSSAGGGFWQSNFVGPTLSRRGASAAHGDFDGDGFVDLAIGDDMDGTGRVIVWH